jgi:hypothetical protein
MSTLGKGNGVEVVDVEGDRPWQAYIDSLLVLMQTVKLSIWNVEVVAWVLGQM